VVTGRRDEVSGDYEAKRQHGVLPATRVKYGRSRITSMYERKQFVLHGNGFFGKAHEPRGARRRFSRTGRERFYTEPKGANVHPSDRDDCLLRRG
jgi:hypothetical protein